MDESPTPSLRALLDRVRPDEDETEPVSVGAILARIGGRSFAPVILLPAMILVAPISGIPGTPTIGMLIIVTVTLQAFWGRKHLWLPGILTRRTLPARRLRQAVRWLDRPAAWIERNTRPRWHALTVAPFNRFVYLAILVITLPWPLLEPLPMVTSIGAFAVSLFALGLVLRDGLFIVAGFGFAGVLAAALVALWQGFI